MNSKILANNHDYILAYCNESKSGITVSFQGVILLSAYSIFVTCHIIFNYILWQMSWTGGLCVVAQEALL